MDNFDLKKYLTENKITANSKILNEAPENLNKSDVSDSKNEQELINMIKDIIDSEVYYGDMGLDPDSVKEAAKAIVNILKKQGLI
jgi:hypothetical protein